MQGAWRCLLPQPETLNARLDLQIRNFSTCLAAYLPPGRRSGLPVSSGRGSVGGFAWTKACGLPLFVFLPRAARCAGEVRGIERSGAAVFASLTFGARPRHCERTHNILIPAAQHNGLKMPVPSICGAAIPPTSCTRAACNPLAAHALQSGSSPCEAKRRTGGTQVRGDACRRQPRGKVLPGRLQGATSRAQHGQSLPVGLLCLCPGSGPPESHQRRALAEGERALVPDGTMFRISISGAGKDAGLRVNLWASSTRVARHLETLNPRQHRIRKQDILQPTWGKVPEQQEATAKMDRSMRCTCVGTIRGDGLSGTTPPTPPNEPPARRGPNKARRPPK